MAATTAKTDVDTRVLGKLKNYDGQQDGWQYWSFAMRAYLNCLSEVMADLLDAAEEPRDDRARAIARSDKSRSATALLHLGFALQRQRAAGCWALRNTTASRLGAGCTSAMSPQQVADTCL